MTLTQRQKDTVRVKFLKSYNPSQKAGGVIYKEDEIHLMTKATVEKIKGYGASVEVSTIDWEKETEAAKKEVEAAQKAEAAQ